jgi:SEC-C motif-containing protein
MTRVLVADEAGAIETAAVQNAPQAMNTAPPWAARSAWLHNGCAVQLSPASSDSISVPESVLEQARAPTTQQARRSTSACSRVVMFTTDQEPRALAIVSTRAYLRCPPRTCAGCATNPPMSCPCGSALERDACCGPILEGKRAAKTAEALMRSRYTAYVEKQVAYIVDSHDPETRDEVDPKDVRNWAERANWQELKILSTQAGGESDENGEVEFIARFTDERDREHSHHERSTFVKRDGRWYYVDGVTPRTPPVTREAPKVGRNDACPCGSGKKYKKCHGMRA